MSTVVHHSYNTPLGGEPGHSSGMHNSSGRGIVHMLAIASGEEAACYAHMQVIPSTDEAPNGEVGPSRHANRRAIIRCEETAGHAPVHHAPSQDGAPNGDAGSSHYSGRRHHGYITRRDRGDWGRTYDKTSRDIEGNPGVEGH